MNHTDIVRLILDGTHGTGVLFHCLTQTQRDNLQKAGRSYAVVHATDCSESRRANLDIATSKVLSAIGR